MCILINGFARIFPVNAAKLTICLGSHKGSPRLIYKKFSDYVYYVYCSHVVHLTAACDVNIGTCLHIIALLHSHVVVRSLSYFYLRDLIGFWLNVLLNCF